MRKSFSEKKICRKNLFFHLQIVTDVPCTYSSLESYILVTSDQASGVVRAKFQFRTHDEDGLMMYHSMNDPSEVRVCIINVSQCMTKPPLQHMCWVRAQISVYICKAKSEPSVITGGILLIKLQKLWTDWICAGWSESPLAQCFPMPWLIYIYIFTYRNGFLLLCKQLII